jgi:chromosome segregation ATPase
MSTVAEQPIHPDLPRSWGRLEKVAEEASLALSYWKRRAEEAEDEVNRLRQSLEGLANGRDEPGSVEEELGRLRAENAALHSRMLQARTRVNTLLKRLISLGIES